MGQCHKILFFLIIQIVCGCIYAQSTNVAAQLTDFALPEYRDDGRELQYIIYGKKAVNLGDLVNLTSPRLDCVFPGFDDITRITPLLNMECYPLTASLKERQTFWKKAQTSQMLFFSEKGVYEKSKKILRSADKVYFRSREMDVDGVGYDAFFKSRFVHVRSKVRVVIHPEAINR